MGLFRRKKAEEVPPAPTVREDATWREWANMGFSQFEEGNTPNAVIHWVGAVDRYDDDTPKQLQFMRDRIYKGFLSQLRTSTKEGKVVPIHLVSEFDAEVYKKFHGVFDSHVTEDLFYDVKEALSDASGPQEVTMLFMSGLFASVGYLRYVADIDDAISKCREAVRLGRESCTICEEFNGKKYVGRLRPSNAIGFIKALDYTMDQIAVALEAARDGMSEEQRKALTEYHRTHVEDRLEHLGAAVHFGINSIGAGRISEKKMKQGLGEHIPAFVEDFLRME